MNLFLNQMYGTAVVHEALKYFHTFVSLYERYHFHLTVESISNLAVLYFTFFEYLYNIYCT